MFLLCVLMNRRHLGLQLMEMEKLIERMMRAEFVSFTHSLFYKPIAEEDTFVDHVRVIFNHATILILWQSLVVCAEINSWSFFATVIMVCCWSFWI